MGRAQTCQCPCACSRELEPSTETLEQKGFGGGIEIIGRGKIVPIHYIVNVLSRIGRRLSEWHGERRKWTNCRNDIGGDGWIHSSTEQIDSIHTPAAVGIV
jgi:hypothetical protein